MEQDSSGVPSTLRAELEDEGVSGLEIMWTPYPIRNRVSGVGRDAPPGIPEFLLAESGLVACTAFVPFGFGMRLLGCRHLRDSVTPPLSRLTLLTQGIADRRIS